MVFRRVAAPRIDSPVAVLVLTLLLTFAGALVPVDVGACDICAVYTATELQGSRTGFRLGLAEQISSFGTLQFEGDDVENPAGESLTSAITQVLAGYQWHPRLGFQLALPWIYRDFRRSTADGVAHGNEVGIGDLSLLASWAAYVRNDEDSIVRLTLRGGVKFPTGSSSRLREELEEPLDPNDVRDRLNENMGYKRLGLPVSRPQAHLGPGGPVSGIHGHDLALGTGSTDFIVGGDVLWTWKRAILTADLQYVVRTEGSYDYRYANELTASINPGVFALLTHRHSIVLQFASTYEHKGKDDLAGATMDDTALTAVYIGPGIHFTRGSSLSLDFVADLPVLLDNSSLQIMPDFRLRSGFVWRF